MKLRIMTLLVLLLVTFQIVSAETHTLQCFTTTVTPGINFPQFTAVGMIDGEQFVYYDSNIRKATPKTDWMKKVDADDPEYLKAQTQRGEYGQEIFRINVDSVMKLFNHTEGDHTWQVMYGCELDGDISRRLFVQYGYDGEDFISLDLNTLTWTAAKHQAVLKKHSWEVILNGGPAVYWKNYLESDCMDWLKKFVVNGKDNLERKVPPEASLFQKNSSSPVVCHATGFFPRTVRISWKKNGEDLHEDVELRETLTNQDGTFQKRSFLRVSPEYLEKHEFTCVIQHSSLEKNMELQVSERRVLSGGGSVGVIIVAVMVVLLLVLIGCVVFIIWKKNEK